jgi:hypothetical protein
MGKAMATGSHLGTGHTNSGRVDGKGDDSEKGPCRQQRRDADGSSRAPEGLEIPQTLGLIVALDQSLFTRDFFVE